MILYAADDPLVLNGTYDREGFKPGERARIEKAAARQFAEQQRCVHKFNVDGFCPECSATRPTPQEETPMAKRGPKPGTKRTKPTKPATRTNGRQPRQAPLRGMEDVRIRALDDVATSIAETREQMNTLRGEESDHLRNALKLMRKHQRTTWRAAGVELARVPGEEKLRVRTTKQAATAEVEDEEGEHVEVRSTEVTDGPGEEIRPGVQAEH